MRVARRNPATVHSHPAGGPTGKKEETGLPSLAFPSTHWAESPMLTMLTMLTGVLFIFIYNLSD